MALGLIARARIEYDWDTERDRYVRNLMSGVRSSIEKATMEGIQFATDGMAVFHRLAGNRFRRYLQTGDDNELGDFKDMSFKTYRDLVSLLQTLTGKEAPQPQKMPIAEIVVRNETPQPQGSTPELTLHDDRPVSAAEAAAMLQLFSGEKG